jgi:hypothetical protein
MSSKLGAAVTNLGDRIRKQSFDENRMDVIRGFLELAPEGCISGENTAEWMRYFSFDEGKYAMVEAFVSQKALQSPISGACVTKMLKRFSFDDLKSKCFETLIENKYYSCDYNDLPGFLQCFSFDDGKECVVKLCAAMSRSPLTLDQYEQITKLCPDMSNEVRDAWNAKLDKSDQEKLAAKQIVLVKAREEKMKHVLDIPPSDMWAKSIQTIFTDGSKTTGYLTFKNFGTLPMRVKEVSMHDYEIYHGDQIFYVSLYKNGSSRGAAVCIT